MASGEWERSRQDNDSEMGIEIDTDEDIKDKDIFEYIYNIYVYIYIYIYIYMKSIYMVSRNTAVQAVQDKIAAALFLEKLTKLKFIDFFQNGCS